MRRNRSRWLFIMHIRNGSTSSGGRISGGSVTVNVHSHSVRNIGSGTAQRDNVKEQRATDREIDKKKVNTMRICVNAMGLA